MSKNIPPTVSFLFAFIFLVRNIVAALVPPINLNFYVDMGIISYRPGTDFS